MIKGIIFDYGGTIDTKGVHWSHVIEEGYTQAQVLVDHDDFLDAYVYGERELARVRHILPEYDFHDVMLQKVTIELQYLAQQSKFPPQLIQEKAKAIADYCYDYAHKCADESKQALDKLRGKYPMVLVSNFYGNINSVLRDFGLDKYFLAVIESAVVGVKKPDSAIFQLGLNALDLPANEVLVVGDSLKKDIEPARSLGCQALWLKGKGWEGEKGEPLPPCDITCIASLDEVLAFVEK